MVFLRAEFYRKNKKEKKDFEGNKHLIRDKNYLSLKGSADVSSLFAFLTKQTQNQKEIKKKKKEKKKERTKGKEKNLDKFILSSTDFVVEFG